MIGMSKVEKKRSKKVGKVGILTWHYYSNFGSALQAYALQTIIASQGYFVDFINYRNPKFGDFSGITGIKYSIISLLKQLIAKIPLEYTRKYYDGRLLFEKKYLKCGKLIQDISELSSITSDYYALVCGSDQIWAPNCYNPVYFATFANKSIRKVSYAASIGLNSIPKELVPVYKQNLSDFYAIGIREQEGYDLLKNHCGLDSTVVIDPTLLVHRDNYANIERSVNLSGEKFLFVYILNKNHQYKERIVDYATKKGLKIIGISLCSEDSSWMDKTFHFTNLGADSFIWMIHHAEAVITDSYHGTIFSMLFHKNFYTFVRFDENDPICQNSRIRQLNIYFNIHERLIGPHDSLYEKSLFDYNNFEDCLNVLRKQSLDFLNNALL